MVDIVSCGQSGLSAVSDTEVVITRTEIGAVSHAGERIVKANRSIQ